MLEVSSFKTTNSVPNITDENISLSISVPGHWNPEDGEELINNLNKLLELRSENHIELHVKEVKKRETRIEIDNSGCITAGFDPFKGEVLLELKRVKNKDVEFMVNRMELTYDEIVDTMDVKSNAGSTMGYTLPPGINIITDLSLMLKSLLPNEEKLKITIDDVRLISNLTTNKTIRYPKKCFFLYHIRI